MTEDFECQVFTEGEVKVPVRNMQYGGLKQFVYEFSCLIFGQNV